MVDPIPTAVISPNWLRIAVTAAPTKGATPRPPVDPRETIFPPLGNWFWFTSPCTIIWFPVNADEIPVNTMSWVDVPTKS